MALVAALVALIPALGSYLHTMSQPSNSSLGIRSVEWLRDNGAAGLVSQVESIYYSLTAPSKGGPTLRALPTVGYGSAGVSRARRATASSAGAIALAGAQAYRPPRVAPLIHPALPGEGVWRAARRGAGAHAPVLVTTLRDQPEYPRVVAGLAWIDARRTRLAFYPGR